MRLGLIGAGGIARHRHVPCVATLPNMEIIAVCNTSMKTAQKIATDFQIPKIYLDYQTMLKEEELDGVIISTPNAYHAPAAIAAMRAGVHVLCEKPMTAILRDAEEMVNVAEETGKILMIALNNRFRPEST